MITFDTNELRNALATIAQVLPSRSVVDTTKGVWFEMTAGSDFCLIEANGFSAEAKVIVAASTDADFQMFIDKGELLTVVNHGTDETVGFSRDKNGKIVCTIAKAKLSEYPHNMRVPCDFGFIENGKFNGDEFKNLLQFSGVYLSDDVSKNPEPMTQAVFIGDGKISGTNKFCATVASFGIGAVDAVISVDLLKAINSIGGMVNIRSEDNCLYVEGKDASIKLLQTSLPKSIVPSMIEKFAEGVVYRDLDGESLLRTLRLAVALDADGRVMLDAPDGEGVLRIASDKIDAEAKIGDGSSFSARFNPKYLIAALAKLPGRVEIGLTDQGMLIRQGNKIAMIGRVEK